MGAGDGGGKRLAIISLGTISEPKKMPLACEHSMSLSLCLLGRRCTGTLTQLRNYFWDIIIKGQIFDFSISTGLALGHEELAIHESNKIGDKNLNRLHVHIVCR